MNDKIRCRECGAVRDRDDWLDHLSDGGHAAKTIKINFEEIPESEFCKTCHGNGFYMDDIFVGDTKVGHEQVGCQECNETGVKE